MQVMHSGKWSILSVCLSVYLLQKRYAGNAFWKGSVMSVCLSITKADHLEDLRMPLMLQERLAGTDWVWWWWDVRQSTLSRTEQLWKQTSLTIQTRAMDCTLPVWSSLTKDDIKVICSRILTSTHLLPLQTTADSQNSQNSIIEFL